MLNISGVLAGVHNKVLSLPHTKRCYLLNHRNSRITPTSAGPESQRVQRVTGWFFAWHRGQVTRK